MKCKMRSGYSITAEGIYNKYADSNGLVSISDLVKEGWTKSRAEEAGLIIKETFRPVAGK